jgi:hypothetical protein
MYHSAADWCFQAIWLTPKAPTLLQHRTASFVLPNEGVEKVANREEGRNKGLRFPSRGP